MNEQINVSDMVLMTGGDGEIVSGGFDVGSLLLKNQLTKSNDAVYKTLSNTSIPVGLLYGGVKEMEKEDILEGLHGGISNSQIIDDELYTKLLNDWSFMASSIGEQQSKNPTLKKLAKGGVCGVSPQKKKKTIRQKGKKEDSRKTRHTKRNRH